MEKTLIPAQGGCPVNLMKQCSPFFRPSVKIAIIPMEQERLPAVRKMILAASEAKSLEADVAELEEAVAGALGETRIALEQHLTEMHIQLDGPMEQYKGSLETLLPMQQGDFEEDLVGHVAQPT